MISRVIQWERCGPNRHRIIIRDEPAATQDDERYRLMMNVQWQNNEFCAAQARGNPTPGGVGILGSLFGGLF